MINFRGTTDFYLSGPTAVTLGKFDGVHRGHQKLMNRIRQLEKEHCGLTGTAFVFNANPKQLLMTEQEQSAYLEQLGISALVQCPFVPEISGMDPETFIREVLINRLHAGYVVVGTDFHFGFHRAGDVDFLARMQEKYGYTVEIVEKERCRGREISSTFVREALQDGQMELAQELLGRPYSLSGRVMHGRHLGHTWGIPTANLVWPAAKVSPPDGVYFSRTLLGGRLVDGITNIGYKPTVGSPYRSAETYLFADPAEEIYDREITAFLLHFERPEQKFPDIEALKEQIKKDISQAKTYFGAFSPQG